MIGHTCCLRNCLRGNRPEAASRGSRRSSRDRRTAPALARQSHNDCQSASGICDAYTMKMRV